MKAMLRVVAFLAGAIAAHGAQAQIEKRDVHIAVGGKSALYYLPLTVTERRLMEWQPRGGEMQRI